MKPVLACLLGLFFACSMAAGAIAQDIKPAQLSDADRVAIGKIEQYLNSIQSMEARFLQVSTNGSYAEGKIHLWRPGKLRLDYDPPSPIEIIGAKGRLIYHDKSLEQVSWLDLDDTPAGLLVQEQISLFSDELIITGFAHGALTYRLSLARADDPLAGSMTLVLSDKPLQLKKWEILDAQGVMTTVSLMASRFGVAIDPEVFVFRNPYANRGPDR
jgi:outer membrane lipoprotein-sorting protein